MIYVYHSERRDGGDHDMKGFTTIEAAVRFMRELLARYSPNDFEVVIIEGVDVGFDVMKRLGVKP